jgi:hypothetical protein
MEPMPEYRVVGVITRLFDPMKLEERVPKIVHWLVYSSSATMTGLAAVMTVMNVITVIVVITFFR